MGLLCYLPWRVEVTRNAARRHQDVTAGHTVLTKSARLQRPTQLYDLKFILQSRKEKMNTNNVAARVISKQVLQIKEQC